MKDVVFKRQALVLITRGVLAVLVVSVLVGSFVVHSAQGDPNLTGATETSGCATPLIPRENMLYTLSSQMNPPLNLSAIDTNGRLFWIQPFANFLPNAASLEVRNGIVYAFATIFNGKSNLNIVAAYDANSRKQLWSIQVPADAQAPTNNAIVNMSICNTMMYLWTQDAIYAYNAKNGSLLWQDKGITFQAAHTHQLKDPVLQLRPSRSAGG
jgi:outer membrane protein assembly factor BamB